MNVFVIEYADYEGNWLIAVFRTMYAAKKAAAYLNEHPLPGGRALQYYVSKYPLHDFKSWGATID